MLAIDHHRRRRRERSKQPYGNAKGPKKPFSDILHVCNRKQSHFLDHKYHTAEKIEELGCMLRSVNIKEHFSKIAIFRGGSVCSRTRYGASFSNCHHSMNILLMLRVYSTRYFNICSSNFQFQTVFKTFQIWEIQEEKPESIDSLFEKTCYKGSLPGTDSKCPGFDCCTSIMRTCVPIVTIKLISFARAEQLAGVKSTNGLTGLECYATSSPNEKILCPVGRNTFCVKEVASSSRYSCGGSEDHPFDSWDIKECIYKKCSSKCLNETTRSLFDNQGEINSRSTFCCSESLCNSCDKTSVRISVLLSIAITAIAIFRD